MNLQHMIENQYFEWLYEYVCKNRVNSQISYRKLLMFLHEIEFTYTIPQDLNRAKDGEDLRLRFYVESDDMRNIPIFHSLHGPCSVLEMMVALSIRCEETIMDDTLYGNRTAQWFWNMLSNMGIGLMTDDIYDRNIVRIKINKLLSRSYEPNGKGGLFYIRDCEYDLTSVEIWAQLCWYLDKFM